MEEEKKGFVVRDKRFSGESGKDRDVEKPAEREDAEQLAAGDQEMAGQEPPETDYLPEVNFYNFVVSLSTTAFYHFGDFAEPATEQQEKNLPAVKQIIDTLAMLQQKTTGNLEADERDLLEGVLYELRMRYVKESP